MYYVPSLLFSSPARKVRKLDSSNLQFRRTRRPANYMHVARIVRELTLSPGFKLEVRLKDGGVSGGGDGGGEVTPGGNRGGCLIRVYIRYVISSRRNYVLITPDRFPALCCRTGRSNLARSMEERRANRTVRHFRERIFTTPAATSGFFYLFVTPCSLPFARLVLFICVIYQLLRRGKEKSSGNGRWEKRYRR